MGLLADLAVEIEADNPTPQPGGEVSFTVTANNKGPSEAPATAVKIELSEGLTFSSSTAAGAYDADSGEWGVGDLAANAATTMKLTLNVAQNTHGEKLSATASISARETIGGSKVVELDPHKENNTGVGTVTVFASPNVNPVFGVARSVEDNATAGTKVGGPVLVIDPISGTHTFELSGDGSGNFATTTVPDGVQISVAAGASLDHESTPIYNLMLKVSDGLDTAGNVNTTTDDTIPLRIHVTDVHAPLIATLAAHPAQAFSGDNVTLIANYYNPPEGDVELKYRYEQERTNSDLSTYFSAIATTSDPTHTVSSEGLGVTTYRVVIFYEDDQGGVVEEATSLPVDVT